MTSIHDTTWNATLYDDKHDFVFKFGEDVVKLLAPQNGERILDIGCGTGYLTHLIAQAGARVTGSCRQRIFIFQHPSTPSSPTPPFIGYSTKRAPWTT